MNRLVLVALLGTVGVHKLMAQSACRSSVPPKPAGLSCSNAAPVCITDQNRVSGHWVWGCPNPSQPSWIDLLPKPPQPESASDIMLKAAEARRLRQEAELLRQQTEALRQQNEAQSIQGIVGNSTPRPIIGPYTDAYATMPKPTGNKKVDQRNWKLWLKQRPAIQPIPWSPDAYEQMRKMAITEIAGGNQ